MTDTLIAGKYTSEEELNKGVLNKITQDYGSVEDFYKNLEKGQVTIGKQQNSPPSDLAIKQDTVTLDMAKNEIMSKGEVSKNTYAELAKVMPKDALDLALNSLESQKSAGESAVYDMVGGTEKYAELTTWAKENLSATDVKGFNQAISSGNSYIQKAAIQSLQSAYQQKEGTGGTRIAGEPGSNVGLSGYQSHREMVNDMKDPKYKTDPAFRANVQKRVAKSAF
jgi:hypothetical protein